MTKQKDKGINHKLYLARDSVVEYRSFENEMSFYDAVKNGDLETVEEEMQKFQKEALQGKGVLSDNIVRNLRRLEKFFPLILPFCIIVKLHIQFHGAKISTLSIESASHARFQIFHDVFNIFNLRAVFISIFQVYDDFWHVIHFGNVRKNRSVHSISLL